MTIQVAMWILTIIASAGTGVAVTLAVVYRRGRRDDLGFELGLVTGGRIVRHALAAVAARLATATPTEAATIAAVVTHVREELAENGVNA
jgi:hypothetical protein